MRLSDRIAVHAWPQEIENVLEQWLGNKPDGACVGSFCPRTDMVEQDDRFLLPIELPGVDASDVALAAAADTLRLRGEKKAVGLAENEKRHRSERISGKFRRSFEFPTQVDFDRIEASFKQGVLSVTVPKSAKVMPRQIKIQVNDASQ